MSTLMKVRSRRNAAAGVALIAIALLAATAAMAAVKLKPYSFFAQRNHVTWQISENGKQLLSFQGYCTPNEKTTKVLVNVFEPIPVNAKGKFKWSKPNALNTPAGETLENEAKLTIEGEFVSKTEAKGSYQIHEAGCKKIKFTAKQD